MGYILDAAVILLFVFMILRGRKEGFAKSLIGIAGVVAALVLAISFSKPLAATVYNTFVQKSVTSAVETAVNDAIGNAGAALDNNLQAAQDALPSYLQNLMEKSGFSLSEITLNVDSGAGSVGTQIATAVEQQVVQPVVTVLLRYVVGIILLIVLLLLAHLLSRLLRKIIRVTPLKKLDGLLGAVLGAVRGVVFVLLLVTVVQLIAGFTAADAFISQKTIEQSMVFEWIANNNFVFSAGETVMAQAHNLLAK